MSEGSGRQEMERRRIQRSLEDEVFRQMLLDNPREAVEQVVVVRPVLRFSNRLPGS